MGQTGLAGATIAPKTNSVYWIGTDGNAWIKGPNGVQNIGAPTSVSDYGVETNKSSAVAKRISDPNPNGVLGDTTQSPNLNGGSSRSGSTGGASSVDPSTLWEYQDTINQADNYLGLIPQQQAAFNNGLTSTFANYRANLQNDFNRNKSNYDTNRAQTIQDQERAKAAIDTKVRSRSSALQRMLGSAGAGDSEAAQFLAPYAAARTGTQLRSEVNDKYGRNLSGLDNSWNQYGTDHENSMRSLADEEANQRRAKEAEFLQKQYDLTNQRSSAEQALRYLQSGDANSARALREQTLPVLYQLLQQITGLGQTQVTPTKQDISYKAPELSQYTTEGAQDLQGIDQSVSNDVSPYYQWLLKKQQEQSQFGY